MRLQGSMCEKELGREKRNVRSFRGENWLPPCVALKNTSLGQFIRKTAITNICAPNNRASRFLKKKKQIRKQNWTKLKGEADRAKS